MPEKNAVVKLFNSHYDDDKVEKESIQHLECCIVYFEIHRNWNSLKDEYSDVKNESEVVTREIEKARDVAATAMNTFAVGDKFWDFTYRVLIAVLIVTAGGFVSDNYSQLSGKTDIGIIMIIISFCSFFFGFFAKKIIFSFTYKLRKLSNAITTYTHEKLGK